MDTSIVVIPTPLFFSLFMAALMAVIIWSCMNWIWSRQNKKLPVENNTPAETPLADVETAQMPALPAWQRFTSPLETSDTSMSRIFRRQHAKRYPFLLPSLDPMTPPPDVMCEPARVQKVVMRAGDWVESRDQFGFVMPDFSGPWSPALQGKIDVVYQGVWLVPKEMTGQRRIVRFKRVRPTDSQIPPVISPRYLPETQEEIKEESPLH